MPNFHSWLSTPEALEAAEHAAYLADDSVPGRRDMSMDEITSEALAVLAECALPPRNSWSTSANGIRRHAGGSLTPLGHIGSMWTWPESERAEYAVREIGLRLAHYLRVRG